MPIPDRSSPLCTPGKDVAGLRDYLVSRPAGTLLPASEEVGSSRDLSRAPPFVRVR